MTAEIRKEAIKRERMIDKAHFLGYDYVNGNLEYKHIPRVHVDRLRELCFPDTIEDAQRRAQAVAEGQKLFKDKAWFSTQSWFYDLRLSHPEMKTCSSLRRDLGELVKMGACDSLSRRAAEMDKAFREREEIRRDRKGIFARYERLEQQAAFDIDLFRKAYFEKDGRPERSVTPHAMLLANVDLGVAWSLQTMAAATDGLHFEHQIHTSSGGVCVIGWNQSEVTSRMAEWMNEHGDGEEEEDERDLRDVFVKWADAFERHQDYLVNKEETDGRGEPDQVEAHRTGFTEMRLEDVLGSYLVGCPVLWKDYPDYGEAFSLNIRPASRPVEDAGFLVADMKFGVVKGTMILSFSQEQLKLVRSETEEGWSGERVEDLGDLWLRERPEDLAYRLLYGERQEPAPVRTLPPLKKREPNALQRSGFRRVYFTWKGYEKTGGLAVMDDGYLDFNETCTAFQGVTRMLILGDTTLSFEGFKLRDSSPTPGWTADTPVHGAPRKEKRKEEDPETSSDSEDNVGFVIPDRTRTVQSLAGNLFILKTLFMIYDV
ncbi:hypothetical protein CH63R_03680 [Colletotrichum higginsianum IMI 349063]|uniref:Uncharacterized protein n=1 Tax=Colletotrichum higginsianum (strain IMI 349063) TaxID=759273 RepID=A0A1B7YHM7_COLHI|nr:hypothetical protein CH63R_03680 [Colletotrichum higginsianum IMI 349063]OBR11384.1 hypothetical protein CH63R_03680 [Colletotrichum higginsianum IMI 349063]